MPLHQKVSKGIFKSNIQRIHTYICMYIYIYIYKLNNENDSKQGAPPRMNFEAQPIL